MIENSEVSSAKSFTFVDILSGKSLKLNKNSNGPRTEPWGTPGSTHSFWSPVQRNKVANFFSKFYRKG